MKGFYALLITLWLTTGLQASFEKYCNTRFGFCVDVDTQWGKEAAPANNDGRSFFDGEGLRVNVRGSYNALGERLREAMDNAKNGLDRVTYETMRGNWFVVSGYKGSDIVYTKVFLHNNTYYTLLITYSTALQKKYNAIVTRLSKTFRLLL